MPPPADAVDSATHAASNRYAAVCSARATLQAKASSSDLLPALCASFTTADCRVFP